MTSRLQPTEEQRHTFVHDGQKVYEWDQTLEEVNIFVDVPAGVGAKHLACVIKANHLTFGIKGNPPFLDADLPRTIVLEESTWTIEDGVLHFTLQKAEKGNIWPAAIQGHEQLNPLQSDEDRKRIMLERFQAEHPGFDFSGADFSGQVPDPATFMGGIGETQP